MRCVECGTTENLKPTENSTDITLCADCLEMLNGTEADKPIHKYDPATGKSRRGHHA